MIGADTVVAAFEEAIEDTDVEAIVLRIDSPGGSAVASESIRRAVIRAKKAGKPVLVSMAGSAASGGYWIATDADRIIAQPATLTGSIGVFGGKMVTAGLWEEIGVHWGRIERGRNAGIWSSLEPYTETGRLRLSAMLDSIYEAFGARVAEGRNLPIDRVREIARGRVWTGHQALALGLVDELGDLELALVRAREAAGLDGEAGITLQVFPRPRSTLERAM